jgi:hypothetical protein
VVAVRSTTHAHEDRLARNPSSGQSCVVCQHCDTIEISVRGTIIHLCNWHVMLKREKVERRDVEERMKHERGVGVDAG